MTVTKYMWDPDFDTVMKEEDELGVTTAEYNYEPVQYGRLISQNRDGETSYYHYDGLGSTNALTVANGDVTDTYEYDAWGNATASTGSTVNPFLWVGQLGYHFDLGTEKCYIRARTYEPRNARWWGVDPIRQKGWQGVYVYSHNTPIDLTDPSGLAANVCIRISLTIGQWRGVALGATNTVLGPPLPGPSPESKKNVTVLSLSCAASRSVTASYACHPCCGHPGNPVTHSRETLSDYTFPVSFGLESDIDVDTSSVDTCPPVWPKWLPCPFSILLYEKWGSTVAKGNADGACEAELRKRRIEAKGRIPVTEAASPEKIFPNSFSCDIGRGIPLPPKAS